MKNKDRYDLRELANTLSYNNSGVVIKYDGKEIFYGDENTLIQNFKNILKWLEQEYSPLDEKEKEYLRRVIRPWRPKWRVSNIKKSTWLFSDNISRECLTITIYDKGLHLWYVQLPPFEKGTMYQGMELDKEYSLEELNI